LLITAKVRKILAESFGYTETNAARSEIGGGELATGDTRKSAGVLAVFEASIKNALNALEAPTDLLPVL
jgi:hypothetical protein